MKKTVSLIQTLLKMDWPNNGEINWKWKQWSRILQIENFITHHHLNCMAIMDYFMDLTLINLQCQWNNKMTSCKNHIAYSNRWMSKRRDQFYQKFKRKSSMYPLLALNPLHLLLLSKNLLRFPLSSFPQFLSSILLLNFQPLRFALPLQQQLARILLIIGCIVHKTTISRTS